MSKIAVITDTNSSMTPAEAKALGVYLLPMPFVVGANEYYEGVSCTYKHFFELLAAGEDVSTSQPSPEHIISLWEKVLETHDKWFGVTYAEDKDVVVNALRALHESGGYPTPLFNR